MSWQGADLALALDLDQLAVVMGRGARSRSDLRLKRARSSAGDQGTSTESTAGTGCLVGDRQAVL